MPPDSVTIVGGGIGGMATALALSRRGIQVDLFERAAAITAVGAGIQISPNGVAVLAALGLGPEAADVANYPSAVQLRRAEDGARIARVPLGFGTELRWGHPYWQFHRVDLLDLLAEAAVAAGARLHTGKSLLRISADDHVARLEFADGTTHQAACLIAADGIRSQIRRQIFDDNPADYTGHVAWRAVLHAEALATPHPTATLVHVGPGKHVVTYPIAGSTLINLVAVEERRDWAPEGWSQQGDPEELKRQFGTWADPVGALVNSCQKTYLWGLYEHRPLSSWSRGPVVLLGDAVHPMLPFFAQGATMALEDAWVLARALAEASDHASAFAAYEARRRARCTRVQRASAANARVYHLRQPIVRLAAHTGLSLVSHTLPGLFLRRLNWLYGLDVTL